MPNPPPKDDPADDWGDGQKTEQDERGIFPLPDTEPHRSLEYLAGREAGFGEGVRTAVAELKKELRRARCTDDEILTISRRIETRALAKG